MDFRMHTRKIMDQYRKWLRAIREDIYIPNERIRSEKLNEVATEYRQVFEEARAEATRALEDEKMLLEHLANPAPVRAQRSTQELLERRELRDDLERHWARTEGMDIIDRYREALRRDDLMAAQLYEKYASEFIKDHARRAEFADLTYEAQRERLPASARQALSEYENLLAEETEIMLGMIHQSFLVGMDVQNARDAAPTRTRDDVIGEQAQAGGGRNG